MATELSAVPAVPSTTAASLARRFGAEQLPSPIRWANAAAGSRPAFDARFFSVKLTETLVKS